MPFFISQGRFPPDVVNRAERLAELVAKSGGRLVAYFLTFGEYDFLIISEGSIEGVAVSSIVAAGTGAVTELKATLAISAGQMKEACVRASGFASPAMQRATRTLVRSPPSMA
jgi:uncharacterized protein with GYD domain